MVDVLAWASANWGYVTLASTTAAGAGSALKFWLDLGAERRANAADKREQAKQDRENDLHPLERKKKEQDLAMGDVALRRAMIELKQLSMTKGTTSDEFLSEVAAVGLKLATDLGQRFGVRADSMLSTCYAELRKEYNWTPDDIKALLADDPSTTDVARAQARLTLRKINTINKWNEVGKWIPCFVAYWFTNAVSTHAADPSKSAEDIYQAFRVTSRVLSKWAPESVHLVLSTKDEWAARMEQQILAATPDIWDTDWS